MAAPSRARVLRVLLFLSVPPLVGLLGLLAARWVPPGGTLPVASAKDGPTLRLVRHFRASFARPLLLTHAPGEPGHVYVVEQAGRVLRLANTPDATPTPFLDVRAQVSTRHNEEGLLGLAFHPGHAENGRLFVYYSATRPRRSVLSEWRRGADGRVDPESERVLLEVPQPWGNHNGGMIAFGPDGKLYVSLGDGGSAGDPKGTGQDRGDLLGAISRLDVDARSPGLEYGIPPDNPFVGQAGVRPEVWAYGLRNVWRFAFDRETGALWGADVGQNAWEEVDLLERGKNYGWRGYEGFAVYDADVAAQVREHAEPLAAYSRSEGGSVTGGYVYRGQAAPSLRGWYLYADYVSGSVWGLRRRADAPAARGAEAKHHPRAQGVEVRKLLKSGLAIASFGEDAAGEVYVCAFDGAIYRVADR